MGIIVSYISFDFELELKKAKEVDIAVALCSQYAVDKLKRVSDKCDVKMVVGIDLPTPSSVLEQLYEKYPEGLRVGNPNFFHPKVYLITRKNGSMVGYIGSGNFTEGGWLRNVELGYKIDDKGECMGIKRWFMDIWENATELTKSCLDQYKEYEKEWTKIDNQRRVQLSNMLSQTLPIDLVGLKNELKRIKDGYKDYAELCRDRELVIDDIKRAIDYDNGFKNINIREFLDIYELGHIIPSHKKLLEDAVKDGRMRKLFKMLCNEKWSISERFEKAINKNRVSGCGVNVITKIMLVNNPKECMVVNGEIKNFFRKYDREFKRGGYNGWWYEELCEKMGKICAEIGVDNFAVLDELMYSAMKEK